MHIKRAVSAILAVCLIVSFAVYGSVYADETPNIVISDAEAVIGGTAEVAVSFCNNPGVAAAKITVSFDADLSLQEVVYNTEKLGGFVYQPSSYESPVVLNWMSLENITEDFVYATLKFRVSENAQDGAHTVSAGYSNGDIINIDEKNVAFSVTSGNINVNVCTHENITFGGNTGLCCADCGAEIESADVIKFAGAFLTLQNNLRVNFAVNKQQFDKIGFTGLYAVFSMGGKNITVTDYTVSSGYYVFGFKNIAPDRMNETITATLYATKGEDVYTGAQLQYSIVQYCRSMLGKTSSAKLRTLLVDLLNYGSASQVYTGYDTENLANSFLSAEQSAWGTAGDIELTSSANSAYYEIESPDILWKGASLNLNDSITMQFVFSAESTEGLTVKIADEAGNVLEEIESENFVSSGGYYIAKYKGLTAGQMSEAVYVTAYRGGQAVSNTLAYSIESYVYSKRNDSDTNLANLVKQMMKYGNSAYAYTH